MKKFNPERELYKIKYGKRNKIILVCFLIVFVSIISYSFALYQVRHSKRIIYTTVDDFSKDIQLSVYLDDNKQKDFPTGDNYSYKEIECENDDVTIAKWNYKTRVLETSFSKPNKCIVKFETGPSSLVGNCSIGEKLDDCIKNNAVYYPNIINDNTIDENLRYIGANPNNYVYFNCENYNNPTKDTCELWRIIGLMNNVSKVNDDKSIVNESLVKIIRNESIGVYSWDNRDDTSGAEGTFQGNYYGKNDWATATLMKLLNPGYDQNVQPNTTTLAGNSLFWNRGEGLCLGGANNATEPCDFTDIGMRENTRNMIESVRWDVRAFSAESFSKAIDVYEAERRTGTIFDGHSGIWPTDEQINNKQNGKIGLIYLSDYLYATSGGNGEQRNMCLNIAINGNWNGNYSYCRDNDWLYQKDKAIYSISPYGTTLNVDAVNGDGSFFNPGATSHIDVMPVLFLKDNITINGGNGTAENPYLIK